MHVHGRTRTWRFRISRTFWDALIRAEKHWEDKICWFIDGKKSLSEQRIVILLFRHQRDLRKPAIEEKRRLRGRYKMWR